MKKVFRMISLLALGIFTVAIVPFPVTAAEFIMKSHFPPAQWFEMDPIQPNPDASLKSEIEKAAPAWTS